MPKPTVYLVVQAERFAHVTEGIFSTPEKASAFRQKLVAESVAAQQAGELDGEIDFDALYEVHPWVVDELEDAFLEYGAIATSTASGERTVSELAHAEFVAEISPNEFVHYTDGTVGEIAYGRSKTEALAKLQVEAPHS